MSDAERQYQAPPSVLPWVVGIISLVLVLAGALVIIEITGEVRQLLAYHRLAENLKEADYAASAANLERTLAPVSVSGFLSFRGESQKEAFKKQDWINAIQELQAIIILLEEKNFDAAVIKFNVLRDRRLGQLLSSDANKADSNFVIALEKKFEEYQERINALEQRKADIPKQAEENFQYISQNMSFYESLAREIADFFALAPAQESFVGTEMELYESGVLKGLPVLKGVPDGVSSLIDLKNKLDLAGGGVKMTGAGAKEKFEKQLDAYRSSISHYSLNIDKAQGENKGLEEEVSAMKMEILKEGKDLKEQVIILLLSAAKPQASPLAVLIFRQIKPVLS